MGENFKRILLANAKAHCSLHDEPGCAMHSAKRTDAGSAGPRGYWQGVLQAHELVSEGRLLPGRWLRVFQHGDWSWHYWGHLGWVSLAHQGLKRWHRQE